MERPDVQYSFSTQNDILDTTNSRVGAGYDKKTRAPFQAIIEKGRQAKAQDEQDQYEARKSKKETEIKNLARIRHAEAEANRRRAEESKMSINDHKGKLLDELTKNIKAILEEQYREEIRARIYEDEDQIASAYEHDIKDQTKARLVRELESVVKAKLEAEFETEIKQKLAAELVSVVKSELQAKYETEVKQQLVEDLKPVVETELRAKYETEVKQRLAEELQSGIEAELHARYEEKIHNQLMIGPQPDVVHQHKDGQANGVEHEGQCDTLKVLEDDSNRATSTNIDKNGSGYPDLSHHQHLINLNGLPNGQQEAEFARNSETADTDGDAVALPHGMKRSPSSIEDDEEDPYPHRSKRSRSASFKSKGQQSANSNDKIQGDKESLLGLRKGDSNSSEDCQGFHGNVSDEVADYGNVDDIQETNGSLAHSEEAEYDSDEDILAVNGTSLDGRGSDYDTAENTPAEDSLNVDAAFLGREEADYDSAEDIVGSNCYRVIGEAIEYYSTDEDEEEQEQEDNQEVEWEEDEEEEEDYYSEEEESYSTTPQAATYPVAGNGVISFSNTQDTAVILSDSEDDADIVDDKDKTLIGYDGLAALINTKHHDISAEESLFLNAEAV